MTEAADRSNGLTYESFRQLARNPELSANEKIGFPDSYRAGFERHILRDMQRKLPALHRPGSNVVDIGAGCGDLAHALINCCVARGHSLTLIDSAEMLAGLSQVEFRGLVGRFPEEMDELISAEAGSFDVVICYSVFHYVFAEGAWLRLFDSALSLLAPGGGMLLGDIPNESLRNRFFASESGVRFHQEFTNSDEIPAVRFNELKPGAIDDAVLAALVGRARASGFNAYQMPQPASLPMANRREDIVVYRP